MSRNLPTWNEWQDASAALGLRERAGELIGPCPSCGGRDRFHVRARHDGGAIVGCRGCIDGRGIGGGATGFAAVIASAFPDHAAERNRHRERAGYPRRRPTRPNNAPKIWGASEAAEGTPAAAYLRARHAWPPKGKKFPKMPESVRWIPAGGWPKGKGIPPLPNLAAGAILFGYSKPCVTVEALNGLGGRVRETDTKIWRRTFGPKGGGWFVPVPRPGQAVAACEGECDALALALTRPDLEARSFGGSAGLAAARLPADGCGSVIYPDGDRPGRDAARQLRKRYPGAAVDEWRTAGDPAGELAERIAEEIRCGRTTAKAWRSILKTARKRLH